MRLRQHEQVVRQPNQLPLINIVFLMLIFFLLAGTIAPAYELDVAPPKAQHDESKSLHQSTVYVAKNGQVSFRNTLMDIAALGAAVAEGSPGAPDKLRVVVDQGAEGLLLIDVVAQLRGAGVERVYLVTRQGDP